MAARTPTPGSGSAVAAVGALGAAALSMAFRYASGEGESDVPAYMEGRADELDRLRELLLALVDEDAQAYEGLRRARDGDVDDEEALARAVELARETPLRVMELALGALRLAAVGTPQVPVRLRSECGVAAHALRAAVEGGAAVVAANLGEGERGEVVEERRAVVAHLREEAARLLEEVCGTVEEAPA